MEVLSSTLKTGTVKGKKNPALVFFGFLLINSIGYASTTCPGLDVDAVCLNGVWQINITPQTPYWRLMGESVNGQPCSDSMQANDVRWNYAFTSSRLGVAGCNYSLFDNASGKIGLIQIKTGKYVRTGDNWEKGSYPGNWSCYASQETCLFADNYIDAVAIPPFLTDIKLVI